MDILLTRFTGLLLVACLTWYSPRSLAAHFVYDPGVNAKIARELDVPVYFTIPQQAYAPLPLDLPVDTSTGDELVEFRHPDASQSVQTVGLRIYRAHRKGLAAKLAKSGFVQTGDIILSFRPEWGGTGTYPNIQMGISHAGLAVVYRGEIYNIDNPLNAEYIGKLNAKHYAEAKWLHVIRPRGLSAGGLSDVQKNNLKRWALRLGSKAASVYPAQLGFNQDYASPHYTIGAPLDFVRLLGRISLGLSNDKTLNLYCSELAWSLLALRNCDPDQAQDFKSQNVPQCVTPLFDPLAGLGNSWDEPGPHSNLGLAEGPLAVIAAMQLTEAEQSVLIESVFRSVKPLDNISSGHRAVALQMAPIFEPLQGYYSGISKRSLQAQEIRDRFNAMLKPNYSPTSFLINALLPKDNSHSAMDYVGTLQILD